MTSSANKTTTTNDEDDYLRCSQCDVEGTLECNCRTGDVEFKQLKVSQFEEACLFFLTVIIALPFLILISTAITVDWLRARLKKLG